MTKARLFVASIVLLIAGSSTLISCGSSGSNNQTTSSGLKLRAFVSNALYNGGAGNLPVLNIVDAAKDQFSGFTVALSGDVTIPTTMVLSYDHTFTLVSGATDAAIAVVSNASESALKVALPDVAQSTAVDPDNVTAYAAVRNAPVAGQPQGAVEVLTISLVNSSVSVVASIPVPNADYVAVDPTGTRILAFGDGANVATVITKANIGTGTDPRTQICCFDNPESAVFTADGKTAYVMECGPECGGSVAAVSKVDLVADAVVARVPVPAATIAVVQGTNLWVAGTPPGTACGSGTAAANCGTLTPVNLSSLTAGTPVIITDGYHNHIEPTPDGQLFIGAINCTNINLPASGSSAGEVRGCLSIYNPGSGAVVVPPATGNVTGIAPIPGRSTIYIVQGGVFSIYDTTKDKLQTTQITIVGQLYDVKVAF